jgi:thioredoxin-related protein
MYIGLMCRYSCSQKQLSEKYGVQGIPTFIVLDKDGNIKDASARGTVQSEDKSTTLPEKWK